MSGAMLAIWSDVAQERETDYLHWLTREHAAERVGIAGFEAVRVFRADLPGVCRYLILYDLASAAVLTSPAYLARLDAPTPWSRRIMPMLRNFARGGGAVRGLCGSGGGAHLLALRLGQRPTAAAPLPEDPAAAPLLRDPAAPLLQALAAEPRVCAVRLLDVDRQGSDLPTREKALRGGDGSFSGVLLIEATGGMALRDAVLPHRPAIAALAGEAEDIVPYAAVFALRKAELR